MIKTNMQMVEFLSVLDHGHVPDEIQQELCKKIRDLSDYRLLSIADQLEVDSHQLYTNLKCILQDICQTLSGFPE